MADYQDRGGTIYHRLTGMHIPKDLANRDYRDFLAWDAFPGNDPDPPDPPVPVVSGAFALAPATVRTVGNQAAELLRATVPTRSGYDAELSVIAIDEGSGATRKLRVNLTVGRWDGAAVLVGQTVLANHATASPPAIPVASVSGNDYVVTVTGTAGRTISWTIFGEVRRFRPQGF